MIPAETERPSSFTGTGISLAPTLSNAILAPKYPGSSIHIGSLFFRRSLAKRSSACCIPETRTICSAVHRTPRDVRKYSAIASRSGRYPRRSDSCFNHGPKVRARFAAIRPQTSEGNSSMAGAPIRKGRVPSTKARSIQGCGRLYVVTTRRMYAGIVVAWRAGRGAFTRLTNVPNPTREVTYPSACKRSRT